MIGPRKVDKPLVLYGYGKLGKLAAEIFTELGIPYRMTDKHDPDVGVCDDHEAVLVAVCVASEPYKPIENKLALLGYTDVVPVWDIIEAYPEVGIRNGWFGGEITDEDAEGIDVVDWGFCDLSSRGHYLSFREWHCKRDEWLPQNTPIEPMPSLPSTLKDIRKRQVIFNFEFMPKHVVVHQEGYELETIKANLKRLQAFRPSLEVACYHSRDGLWKIPKFLMDNLPDYDFKFRLHSFQGQGAYIYATPKERGEG